MTIDIFQGLKGNGLRLGRKERGEVDSVRKVGLYRLLKCRKASRVRCNSRDEMQCLAFTSLCFAVS